MKIGRHDLNDKVLLVAEIGNNHEGRFDLAKELVRRAAESGVQAVKFQTFKTERFVGQQDVTRYQRLKSFELQPSQFSALADLAHSLGLLFISTPLDMDSASFLHGIVDAYKIASGDINFYPLIAQVVQTGKPLILSTGASDMAQIEKTVLFIRQEYKKMRRAENFVLLHCVSSYPVPPAEANLKNLLTLSSSFSCPIGYSDHTLGNTAAVAAVALGARLIEKHFTLDKHLSDFRDHAMSATPDEMGELVRKIRETEPLLGKMEKVVQPCEVGMVMAIRRSIASAKALTKGHSISWEDLMWIRPAGELPPGEEALLIGKRLKHDVPYGHRFQPSDVE